MLITFVPLNLYSQTNEKNFIDQPYIEVQGKAEMEVAPDLFYISILINEEDSKNKQSVSDLEKKMVDKLKGIGIDTENDLYIKDISSNFKKQILASKDIIIQKEYLLILRDAKTVARTFIELEDAGISNVSIEKVDNSKITEYRKEVRKEAIKAAKEKADYLATAIGQEAGKALYIQELDGGHPMPVYSNSVFFKSMDLTDKSEINPEFEKIKLEYSVLCRFELK